MSVGLGLQSLATTTADFIADTDIPVESPLMRDLVKRVGVGSVTNHEIAAELLEAIKQNLPAFDRELTQARTELTDSVARLRQAGGVVFIAAGNANTPTATEVDAQSLLVVPGMIVVGAADLRDGRDPASARMAGFSSGGRDYTTFSTVGVDVPVGGQGATKSGTSFAAPIGVSIAALMTEVKPRLTPDDIENILKDPRVAHDIPGTERDGAGFVDPVAAVRLARDWPTRS
jgi:subtilisin family serine protease